jgi:DNA-binding XRE family transcriptional regulator
VRGLDAFTTRAFDMVTSGTVRKALDLSQEEPRSRDRYRGVEQFLTARRLVEAGVGCVTLSISGWDTHGDNFNKLKKDLLPALDRGFANLIQDLHDRGMQNDVVTVLCGEMGRTPRITPDIRERFGYAVKMRREELKLTQEELADKAGVHRTYLSDIERGSRNLSLLNIERLAMALALRISELFEAVERTA